MTTLNELKINLDAVVAERQLMENDLKVLKIVIKRILDSEVCSINGNLYFKVEDITRICNEGFKSLSSKIMKEKGMTK
jgi:hypothetical protein